ncbi:MAG: PEP-CTERM sorting domain-containing protein, partial [Planctomycetes bacterium]|nr:PEP-CTERM sorting domain-containing protein [Planctomycetota bacterium]
AGQIKAATGETDLGSTIVVSTAAPSVYTNDVLFQEFYDGLNAAILTRDQILLAVNGAGFNAYTPAFWKASANLDYPGNADAPDPAQPWIEADGNITKDHAGVDIVMPDSDDIGFRATGELVIATAGTYAFSTRSDDGNKLWIDGKVVVDNDYLQGFTERNASVYLDAGPHTIAFGFYERGGGAGFDVRWDPNGGANWAAIPANRFRYAGGASDGVLTVEAPATLKARGVQDLNRLVVNGTLVLGEATSLVRELVVGATGKIDLTRGNLVVNYNPANGPSPYDTVLAQVKAGLGTGTWNGTHGITSSVAATNAQSLFGVACIDNTMAIVGGFTDLEGTAVDASSILLKFTYWGDANLDGVIDANDYDRIDKYYLFPPAVMTWGHGDFNYDGVIDANDYDKIDKAYLFQAAPLGAATADLSAPAPVPTPEPATLALLALGAAATLARRRRTR